MKRVAGVRELAALVGMPEKVAEKPASAPAQGGERLEQMLGSMERAFSSAVEALQQERGKKIEVVLPVPEKKTAEEVWEVTVMAYDGSGRINKMKFVKRT